jgi:hypothetical protein
MAIDPTQFAWTVYVPDIGTGVATAWSVFEVSASVTALKPSNVAVPVAWKTFVKVPVEEICLPLNETAYVAFTVAVLQTPPPSAPMTGVCARAGTSGRQSRGTARTALKCFIDDNLSVRFGLPHGCFIGLE